MMTWHEDDEFWHTAILPMLRERLAKGSEDVTAIVELLGLAPPATVLDLACGIGRHSLELARRGFEVTSVDRTQGFLDEARQLFEAEGLHAELIREDMRRFRRPGAYDLAVNLLTSFAYFEDPEDDRRIVQNVHDSLKGDGVFVLDMMGKENLARIFTPRDWEEKDGEIRLYERRVTKSWSWIDNRWIVIRDGEKREFTLGHRLYSASELARLFEDCGFASVDVYGSLKGAPYDHTAERLVVVGRK